MGYLPWGPLLPVLVILQAFLLVFRPDRTRARVGKVNTWVTSHKEVGIRVILAVAGVFLVISGAAGLASR